jgi:hypothetical protein
LPRLHCCTVLACSRCISSSCCCLSNQVSTSAQTEHR